VRFFTIQIFNELFADIEIDIFYPALLKLGVGAVNT
jgi:hypothetical protein